ncbi:coth-domain-containing protein [Anaeromyces robustus]|jgi:spore coat protein CotH|uniref:Coth-domain-containing protein n=1 Tax=Anaeromyces robustus TaxID=1754192 RepID=A0A1Y1XIC0_9FUNG|nr:coth-domain-containing protein [Anaeromyces robustus]|eukprot:ORX85510.1 coth-domain-containing protein [Anaeromyces robustus]
MNCYLLSLALVLIHTINTCNAVKFKVIGTPNEYGGTGINVVIDGTSHPMTAQPNDILYELDYQGTPNQYYYEMAGNQTMSENILFNGKQRTWTSGNDSTLYEVFGRRYTVGDELIKTIPRIFPPLDGYEKFSKLFQEGEIPVIHITMNSTVYEQLVSTESKDDKFIMEFDYYSPYEKRHFTNATIGLSGQGTMELDKKPFKIDLSPNESDKKNSEIYNRKEFKLRSLRFDESYIKNKLVTDLAESLGLPVTQSGFCRLYINGKSYGLYEISDMYKKKFVRRFFNVEKKGDQYVYGSFYKGSSGKFPAFLYSDFPGSSDPNAEIVDIYDSVIAPTAGYDPHQDIKGMIAWAEGLTEATPKAEIEKKFDIEMFLKSMILEYLNCHWDGYLGNGNNFYIYVEPNNGKYHMITYDFDLAVGKWCRAKEGLIDNYIAHVQDRGNGEKQKTYGSDPRREPLLYKKIIQHPEIRPMWDSLLKEVIEKLFNLQALNDRIEYFHEFLKDDMYWDMDTFAFHTFDTTYSSDGSHQDEPSRESTEEQYNENSENDNLKAFIKFKSEDLKQLLSIPQFQPKGEYGEVGKKITKVSKNDGDGDNLSGSPLVKPSIFITTIIAALLILMMKL